MEEAINNEINETPNDVHNIYPITKGKRFLVWFCDLVITFAISFLLFHFGTYLIMYNATGFEKIAKAAESAEINHNVILSKNNLLFSKDGTYKDFSTMLEYTFSEYSKSLVKDKSYPEEFDAQDVFRTYYVVIRSNPKTYIEKLSYYDRSNQFFDVNTATNRATLKQKYIDLFKPILSSGDEMSEEGKSAYTKLQNIFFLEFYGEVISDINNKDLTYTIDGTTLSYVAEQAKINKADKVFDNNIIVASILAFMVGGAVCYVLIPLLHKERKTLSMMMMRIQRVSISNLLPQNRKQYALTAVTSFLTNFLMVSLLALPQISVNYIFNLPSLLAISGTSLAFAIISLFFMLFSSTNRSLTDKGSMTAYISNDELDEVYRLKGYDV